MTDFPAPLHTTAPGAWMAYADYLREREKPFHHIQLAEKIAQALQRLADPRMVLVGQPIERDASTGKPVRRIYTARGILPHTSAWTFYAFWRWFTPYGFVYGPRRKSSPEHWSTYRSTPADFPRMVEDRPTLAFQFFRRLLQRKGEVPRSAM
jgi:hypothetical protein